MWFSRKIYHYAELSSALAGSPKVCKIKVWRTSVFGVRFSSVIVTGHSSFTPMRILFQCPACERSRLADVGPQTTVLECQNCQWERPVRTADLESGLPRRCLVCGCDDLWRQKDFPQRLGLAMVALGAVLSTIAWAYYEPAIALGILLAFALADMVLFVVMKDVLVCYRCHARYRDAVLTEDHPRFNLETAERYRQEAARLKDSRRTADSAP